MVLAGPSGVGKGAIVAGLLAELPELRPSVSATTRAPRPGELPGRHYDFLSDEAFDELVRSGGLLEWAEIFGHRSGTPRGPVESALAGGRHVLLEIDVNGARQVRRAVPDAFLIFVRPPSTSELERRLRRRGTETDVALERRLAAAEEELAAEPEFDATVVNDDLGRAVAEVARLVRGLD